MFDRREYADSSFWDERFKSLGSEFDWYCDFEDLRHVIEEHCGGVDDRILVVGCGNSRFSLDLAAAGFKNIFNIDISSIVINKMKENTPEELSNFLTWQQMDATEMEFNDNSFDCIIDKGTLDAVATSDDKSIGRKLIQECFRVLKPQGKYILISHSDVKARMHFLSPVPWNVFTSDRFPLNDCSDLVNIARSKYPKDPLRSLFLGENAEKLFAVMAEFKESRKSRLFLKMWLNYKRKRRQKQMDVDSDTNATPPTLDDFLLKVEESTKSENATSDPGESSNSGTRQWHCYVSVLVKPVS